MELNNQLPLLPGSSAAKIMDPKELNKILLHDVPNSWTRKAYIQGWDLEGRSYKEICNMFERTETAEAIYEGGAPSKNTQRAESDRDISGRKKKGGESASPYKPEKGRAGKRKKNYSDCL